MTALDLDLAIRPHLSDADLSAHLSDADLSAAADEGLVPLLLMLIYQVTGDERWLREPYKPVRPKGLDDNATGGLDRKHEIEVRRAAFDALRALRDGDTPAIPAPSSALIVHMMSVGMGEEIGSRYGDLLSEEFRRRVTPGLREPTTKAPDVRVAVVGLGVAGIIAARQLERLGLDFVIYEKQPFVGGVWNQNQYPGAGLTLPATSIRFPLRRMTGRSTTNCATRYVHTVIQPWRT